MSDLGDKVVNGRGLNWREPAPKFITKTYEKQILVDNEIEIIDVFKTPKLNAEYYEDTMRYINDIEVSISGVALTTWYAYSTVSASGSIPTNAILGSGTVGSGVSNTGDRFIKTPLDLTLLTENPGSGTSSSGLKDNGADLNFVNYTRDMRDAWSNLGFKHNHYYHSLSSGNMQFNPHAMDLYSFHETNIASGQIFPNVFVGGASGSASGQISPSVGIPYDELNNNSVGNIQAEFIGNLRHQSWCGYISDNGDLERQEIYTASNKDGKVDPLFRWGQVLNSDGSINLFDIATVLDVPNAYFSIDSRNIHKIPDQVFNYIYVVEKNGMVHAINKNNTPTSKIDFNADDSNFSNGVMSRAIITPRPYDNVESDRFLDVFGPGFIFHNDNNDKSANYVFPHKIIESVQLPFTNITGGSFVDGNQIAATNTTPTIFNANCKVPPTGQELCSQFGSTGWITKSNETPMGAILCNGTNELLYTGLGFVSLDNLDLDIDLLSDLGSLTIEERIENGYKAFVEKSEPHLDTLKTSKIVVRNLKNGNNVDLKIYDICAYTGPMITSNNGGRTGFLRLPPQMNFDYTGSEALTAQNKLDSAYRGQNASIGSKSVQVFLATNKGIILGIFSDSEINVNGDKTTDKVIVCNPDVVLIDGDFRGVSQYHGSTIDDIYKINVSDGTNIFTYQLSVENFNIEEIQSFLISFWTKMVGAKLEVISNDPIAAEDIATSVSCRKRIHAGLFDEFNINDYTLSNGIVNLCPAVGKFLSIVKQDLGGGQLTHSFGTIENNLQRNFTGQGGGSFFPPNFSGEGGWSDEATFDHWEVVAIENGFIDDIPIDDGFGGFFDAEFTAASKMMDFLYSLNGTTFLFADDEHPNGGSDNSFVTSSTDRTIVHTALGLPHVHYDLLLQDDIPSFSVVVRESSPATKSNWGAGRCYFVDQLMMLNNKWDELNSMFDVDWQRNSFSLVAESGGGFSGEVTIDETFNLGGLPQIPSYSFVWNLVDQFQTINGANCLCEPQSTHLGTKDELIGEFYEIHAMPKEITPNLSNSVAVPVNNDDIFSKQQQIDIDAFNALPQSTKDKYDIDNNPRAGVFNVFMPGRIGNINRRSHLYLSHSLSFNKVKTIRDTDAKLLPAKIFGKFPGNFPAIRESVFFYPPLPVEPNDITGNFINDETIGASYILDVDEEITIEHTGNGPIKWIIGKDTSGRIINMEDESSNYLGKSLSIDGRSDCIRFIDPNDEDKVEKKTLTTDAESVILKGIKPGRDRFIYGIDKYGDKAVSMEVFVRGDSVYVSTTRDFDTEKDEGALVTSQDWKGGRKQYPSSKTKTALFTMKKGELISVNVVADDCKNLSNSQIDTVFRGFINNENDDGDPIASITSQTTIDKNTISKRYMTGGIPLIKTFDIMGENVGTVTFLVSTREDGNENPNGGNGSDTDIVTIIVT